MNWAVFTKALIEDLNGGLVQNGAETKTNLSSCVKETAEYQRLKISPTYNILKIFFTPVVIVLGVL